MFPGFFLCSLWVCGVTKNCPNRESDGSPYNLYGGKPSAKPTTEMYTPSTKNLKLKQFSPLTFLHLNNNNILFKQGGTTCNFNYVMMKEI